MSGTSLAVSAVSWGLTLFGVPVPEAVSGAISTVQELIGVLPKDRKDLRKFVENAVDTFETQCGHETRQLPAGDKTAVEETLRDLLRQADRASLLGAALVGTEEFQRQLLTPSALTGLSHDEAGYLRALCGHLQALVRDYAQSEAVLAAASTAAIRIVWAELQRRPTRDEVLAMIAQAVGNELARRRHVIGSRPRLAQDFVERAELVQVGEALAADGVATLCALRGMRGVGKSQLASAFAERCEEEHWSFVGWVNAQSRERAVTELAEGARLILPDAPDDPAAAARRLVGWLSSASDSDRLLVFDNVTDPDDLQDLVPRGHGMRVLVTTTGHHKTLGTPVEVGVYTSEQARRFLIEAAGLADDEVADAVAERLGRLPVALTQAAATIRLEGYDFPGYLAVLDAYPLDEAVEREDGEPYPDRVGAALRIAYRSLLDKLGQDSAPVAGVAHRVLRALSLLAASGVPREWLLVLGDDERSARRAVGELLKYSLVAESSDSSTVALHRLQAQVIREDDASDDHAAAIEAACQVLAAVDPDAPGDYLAKRELNAAVAQQLAAALEQPVVAGLVRAPQWLETVQWTLYRSNAMQDPYSALSLAGYLPILEQVLGENHPATLTSRNNLAGAYRSAGDLAWAIPLYERTLNDCIRVLGEDHPDTLTSRNNLAGAYRSAGDLAWAIPLYERTLNDRIRVLGADHPATLTSRNNLAYAYESAGDLARAIPLYERTLNDRIRVLGEDHPDTLTSRNNLAYAYESAGDLARAISLYEETLNDRIRVLGADHPDTLTSRNNLAGAYESAGDLARAISLYERTLNDCIRVLGADHPDTLTSRNNLAYAYESAGDLARAISLYEETLNDCIRVLGEDHPDTLTSRNNLAYAYRSAGDLARAIPLYERTLNDRIGILGDEDPEKPADGP